MKWDFPMGTIFIKHFFDDGGAGGKQRAIETRFIRAGKAAPYEFFVYKWNADGTDADADRERHRGRSRTRTRT